MNCMKRTEPNPIIQLLSKSHCWLFNNIISSFFFIIQLIRLLVMLIDYFNFPKMFFGWANHWKNPFKLSKQDKVGHKLELIWEKKRTKKNVSISLWLRIQIQKWQQLIRKHRSKKKKKQTSQRMICSISYCKFAFVFIAYESNLTI